jgi:hypothetical protein
MAWHPSAEYWGNKIAAIHAAIEGTRRDLSDLEEGNADERTITAHVAQLNSLKKSLAKAESDYRVWNNKRQNIERGARY